MSVRAYIVYTDFNKQEYVIKRNFNDEEIHCLEKRTYESANPLFNVWHHTEMFDLIRENGYDSTNNDASGEIGIDKDEYYNALDELSTDEFKKIIDLDNGYGKEILKNIDKWFEDNDFLVLNCY